MGYIENNLLVNEKICVRAENSPSAMLFSVFRLVVFIVASIYATDLLQTLNEGEWIDIKIFVILGIWAFTFLFGFIPLVSKIQALKRNELCLTNRRVFGRKGKFNKKTLDVPLSKIDSVIVETPFWGRLFNYSTIIIKTNTEKFVYERLKDGQIFKNKLMQLIEEKKEQEIKEQAQAMFDAMCSAQAKQ